MILSLSGLQWDVASPSHYKLAPSCTRPGCELDISYVGDRWILFLDQHGHVTTRCFDNRDQAIGMVAEAFTREG